MIEALSVAVLVGFGVAVGLGAGFYVLSWVLAAADAVERRVRAWGAP